MKAKYIVIVGKNEECQKIGEFISLQKANNMLDKSVEDNGWGEIWFNGKPIMLIGEKS